MKTDPAIGDHLPEVVRFVLVFVFTWSGFVKLRRPGLAALAMVDFGVLRRVHRPTGALLGAVEIAVASLLLFDPSRFVGGVASAVLLWAFFVLILRAVLKGNEFSCYCFGDAADTISPRTALRTGALAVAATFYVSTFDGATSVGLSTQVLSATTALAVMGVAVLGARVPRLLEWNALPKETI